MPARSLSPYLQLVRLPAIFSAWSNILAAHLIATGGAPRWSLLGIQLGITTTVYWGGMVLNDCFDLAEDRRERPERPLPSGQVPLSVAWSLGLGLLAAGLLLATAVGGAVLWLTLLLSASVLLYDGLLKQGPLAPLAMGACRYLNWLIGLAAAPLAVTALALAFPIFLYTAAATVLSRIETRGTDRQPIAITLALLWLTGFAVAGLHVAALQTQPLALVFLALLLALLSRVLLRGFRNPTPARVQGGVKWLLFGMIPLDAVLLAGDGRWEAAVGLLLLLIPGRLLARRLYIT